MTVEPVRSERKARQKQRAPTLPGDEHAEVIKKQGAKPPMVPTYPTLAASDRWKIRTMLIAPKKSLGQYVFLEEVLDPFLITKLQLEEKFGGGPHLLSYRDEDNHEVASKVIELDGPSRSEKREHAQAQAQADPLSAHMPGRVIGVKGLPPETQLVSSIFQTVFQLQSEQTDKLLAAQREQTKMLLDASRQSSQDSQAMTTEALKAIADVGGKGSGGADTEQIRGMLRDARQENEILRNELRAVRKELTDTMSSLNGTIKELSAENHKFRKDVGLAERKVIDHTNEVSVKDLVELGKLSLPQGLKLLAVWLKGKGELGNFFGGVAQKIEQVEAMGEAAQAAAAPVAAAAAAPVVAVATEAVQQAVSQPLVQSATDAAAAATAMVGG